VLAVGNRLIYTDTYDEALAQLSTGAQQLIQQAGTGSTPGPGGTPAPAAAGAAPATPADARLGRIREHLRRYRELAAQGRWSEAGKELEAIEAEAR
jgi:uncharacterized membrane protein (UPF0182 family)